MACVILVTAQKSLLEEVEDFQVGIQIWPKPKGHPVLAKILWKILYIHYTLKNSHLEGHYLLAERDKYGVHEEHGFCDYIPHLDYVEFCDPFHLSRYLEFMELFSLLAVWFHLHWNLLSLLSVLCQWWLNIFICQIFRTLYWIVIYAFVKLHSFNKLL